MPDAIQGMASSEALAKLECAGCGRSLEWCAFCDREDCSSASCYTCLVVALHESVKQPHALGG